MTSISQWYLSTLAAACIIIGLIYWAPDRGCKLVPATVPVAHEEEARYHFWQHPSNKCSRCHADRSDQFYSSRHQNIEENLKNVSQRF